MTVYGAFQRVTAQGCDAYYIEVSIQPLSALSMVNPYGQPDHKIFVLSSNIWSIEMIEEHTFPFRRADVMSNWILRPEDRIQFLNLL